MEKFTFFWKDRSPFSQWYPSKFTVWGQTFTRGEQAMMWKKAMLFGDTEIADQILATGVPAEQKGLGRKVRNFDSAVWDKNKREIVYEVNKAKFSQSPKLLKALMDTKGTTLVEASPYDLVWGIGYEANHPNAQDRTKWRGQNLLGEILTKVRNDLEDK